MTLFIASKLQAYYLLYFLFYKKGTLFYSFIKEITN